MSYKHHEPGDRISGNSKTGGKFSDLAPRVIHESKGPWTIVDDLIFKAQCMLPTGHIKHSGYEANKRPHLRSIRIWKVTPTYDGGAALWPLRLIQNTWRFSQQ